MTLHALLGTSYSQLCPLSSVHLCVICCQSISLYLCPASCTYHSVLSKASTSNCVVKNSLNKTVIITSLLLTLSIKNGKISCLISSPACAFVSVLSLALNCFAIYQCFLCLRETTGVVFQTGCGCTVGSQPPQDSTGLESPYPMTDGRKGISRG